MISRIRLSPTTPERLPDESARAYRAFCVYRDLGPNRSLDRAWERYCTTSDRGKNRKSARRPGHWGVWSQKFTWVKRAEAYDDLLEEERLNAAYEQRRELREQRSRFEVEQQPQIENHVRCMDVEVERMGSAQHHESTQVKHDKTSGKTITTRIKGFSARDMAILMKARNQTAKLAILGVRDNEEEAKEEGTIDRIIWQTRKPEETAPEQAGQALDEIAKLKKEQGIAAWEDLDEKAA
jgi:hypothetical protein